ncbi:HipA N-terminal domain-containing protein [Escherichia coli]
MRHEKCLARINRTARSGVVMPKLVTWMNNQRVGELTKLANGAHTFKYAPEWLASRYARPLSLSLPLQRGNFLATAKVLRFPEVQMHEILSDFARMIPAALDNVKTSLPTDFPENVVTAVETNVLRLHGRLSREYGSK